MPGLFEKEQPAQMCSLSDIQIVCLLFHTCLLSVLLQSTQGWMQLINVSSSRNRKSYHKRSQQRVAWTHSLRLDKELLDTYNRSETTRLCLSGIIESTDQMPALRLAIQHAIDEGMDDEFSEFLLKVNKELQ